MEKDAATPDPFIGRVLRDHEIERRLGSRPGSVYLARHRELKLSVAALRVLGSQRAAAGLDERFRREARIAEVVGNRRVVIPYHIGRFDDGTPYLLMEYVRGRSLADTLADHDPMPLLDALKIAYRVSDTLVAAHEAGFPHGDLTPSRVLLTRDGDLAKLCDFGITHAPGARGTAGYLSPEGAEGREVDGRADVFSLGVMLFEMLSGELPFPGLTEEESVAAVRSEPAPAIGARRPKRLEASPPLLEEVVARTLIKDPAHRLAIGELRRALFVALKVVTAQSKEVEPLREVALALAALDADEKEPR
ncbi:MAG: serine/threonine protein kinase [Myxococcales bacterium]|nr:serine/threonine protein kinase [Myxococcales bacterium]